MFQMGGFGPMLGQAHHFRIYAPEKIDYAYDRYSKEAQRLYQVLENQLSQSAYLAGDNYTIADIACFAWARSSENQGIQWSDFPNTKRWFDQINQRPAVQRGVQVLADVRKPLTTEKAKEVLFGNAQYSRKQKAT
jgi:GST-like protein